MAAPPSERPDPADWFLQAPGGRFTLRITSGLVIGEDERGHFDIGPDSARPLVRFEIEAGAPCVHVMSPDWVLTAPGRPEMAADSHRLQRTTELSLPNNRFRIFGVGHADGRTERIELTRRESPFLHSAGPSDDEAESATAAPAPAALPAADDITVPMHTDDPTAGRADDPHAARGARTRPEVPGPAPPTPGRAALFSNIPGPDPEPAPHPQPAPPVQPAASPGLFAVPERPHRGRHRSRARSRNRRRRSGPRWSVTLLTIAVYLGGLLFSAPVQSPVPGRGPAGAGGSLSAAAAPAAAAPAPAADDGLLASVEQLLRAQSPPDPSTLDFAVKAYRAAHSRRPDDDRLRRRLAELESLRLNTGNPEKGFRVAPNPD